MKYVSTRGEAPVLSFEDAMLTGLARDGGLYVPETIPQMSADDIAVLKQRILVARIFSRGLSAPQYLEKKARLFIHGRVRTYGLRSAGSRLLRRARLVCYDHGWWRMPRASALRGGMWDAQLPPN